VVAAEESKGLGADFWKFWTGQTISNLGSSFTFFALPLLVFKLTGSALNLAVTMAAEFVPYLLFGLIIGAWVDRLDRKKLMIVVDILRALVVVTVPIVDSADLLSVWWIYGVGFIGSTLNIFFDAGQFAAIPNLVKQDDLVTANGRIQASFQGGQVVGPAVAGALVSLFPIATVMYFDAATFLVSAFSLGLIATSFNPESDEKKSVQTIRKDVAEGLRYVWNHPVLRNISVMMAMVNFIAASTYAQLVLFGKVRLEASDGQIGILFAAGPAGMAAISLLAGQFRRRWSFSTVALGALMMHGAFTIAFALTRSFALAAALWALTSGFGILFNINTISLRQAIVPNHMLGRIMSIAGVLAWSAIPLGAYLGGLIIESLGDPADIAIVYAFIGAFIVVLPVIFAFSPLGHADDYLPRGEPDLPEPPVLTDLPVHSGVSSAQLVDEQPTREP
jgi:MFS family permease